MRYYLLNIAPSAWSVSGQREERPKTSMRGRRYFCNISRLASLSLEMIPKIVPSNGVLMTGPRCWCPIDHITGAQSQTPVGAFLLVGLSSDKEDCDLKDRSIGPLRSEVQLEH
jgi:hypothetical protein